MNAGHAGCSYIRRFNYKHNISRRTVHKFDFSYTLVLRNYIYYIKKGAQHILWKT